eukprot:GFKZ01008573.1.p2 GENE.GFKZ01008573.1~~GFKZ01008573.1.p2  ORF type:complete len:187 (-),score=9.65 GFKZ01008573.1:437-997(-)
MLQRHLSDPVFDDTALLEYAQGRTPMYNLGDHAADLCSKGIGWKNSHDIIVQVLGTHLFKAAGVGVGYKVKYLLPGLHARSAYMLVHPRSSPADSVPPLPEAFDATASLCFQLSFLGPRATRRHVGRRLLGIPLRGGRSGHSLSRFPPSLVRHLRDHRTLDGNLSPKPSTPWERRPPSTTMLLGTM